MDQTVKDFFRNSEFLDYFVLRQLSHIIESWEMTWNPEKNEYEREEGTFAGMLLFKTQTGQRMNAPEDNITTPRRNAFVEQH